LVLRSVFDLVLMGFDLIAAALLCATPLCIDVRISRSLVSVQTLNKLVDGRDLVLAGVLEERVSDMVRDWVMRLKDSRVLQDLFAPGPEPAT
jgi:hypothetical protein